LATYQEEKEERLQIIVLTKYHFVLLLRILSLEILSSRLTGCYLPFRASHPDIICVSRLYSYNISGDGARNYSADPN
jgi:hypothetical protein